jgi:MFS family permease
MATVSSQNTVNMRKMLPVLAASTLGTSIEWYDFFLFGFLSATVFPKVFFPNLDPVTGTILSFLTNFFGFAGRPIGGAFFGWFGDRVGRKSTLIATLLLMGIATFLMGVLPSAAAIGVAAPILLTILRILQGAGVGGEWGGSVLMSLEYGDNRRRGFWASWPQTGVPIGLALAAIAVIVFKAIYGAAAFASPSFAGGWRIPFYLSAALIIVGLFIRLRILDTPLFNKVKQENRVARAPLVEVIRYNWREIVLSALARSGEQAPFYILTTFVLSYGVNALKINVNVLYAGLITAAVIAFFTMPTFSYLSDLVGRKRWFLGASVVMAVIAYPYFLLLETKNPVVVFLTIMVSVGFVHAALYGPEAALISERFGTKLRYTGASLGYQLASLTAGGPAPIIATYLLANHAAFAPGLPGYALIAFYIILMAAVSFFAVLGLREYAQQDVASDVGEPRAGLAPATE